MRTVATKLIGLTCAKPTLNVMGQSSRTRLRSTCILQGACAGTSGISVRPASIARVLVSSQVARCDGSVPVLSICDRALCGVNRGVDMTNRSIAHSHHRSVILFARDLGMHLAQLL